MGQDELDFIETLSASPVLNSVSPAIASVTQTVDEDDGSRVPGGSWENEGRLSGDKRRHFVRVFLSRFSRYLLGRC